MNCTAFRRAVNEPQVLLTVRKVNRTWVGPYAAQVVIAGQVAEVRTSLAVVAPWLWLMKRVKLAELADRACADGACVDGAFVDGACTDGACTGGACADGGCADGGCADGT